MKKLLIAFVIAAVFSGCSPAPTKPDINSYITAAERLKREVPPAITLDKIPVFPKECGEKLCVTNLEWKKLEFEIQLIREKLSFRHLADQSRNRSYNELVDALVNEQIAHAYSNYRRELLAAENDKLRIKAAATRLIDILAFVAALATGTLLTP